MVGRQTRCVRQGLGRNGASFFFEICLNYLVYQCDNRELRVQMWRPFTSVFTRHSSTGCEILRPVAFVAIAYLPQISENVCSTHRMSYGRSKAQRLTVATNQRKMLWSRTVDPSLWKNLSRWRRKVQIEPVISNNKYITQSFHNENINSAVSESISLHLLECVSAKSVFVKFDISCVVCVVFISFCWGRRTVLSRVFSFSLLFFSSLVQVAISFYEVATFKHCVNAFVVV